MDGSDQALATLLRRASLRVGQEQAAALSPHGVTLSEWTVLRGLYDLGATSPSALADACGLTRGAVTKLVDRLRAKRLVVRAAAGREDRRYQTIALTGAGANLVPVLAEIVAQAEARAFAGVEAADRAALASALGALTDPSNRHPREGGDP